jgi:hypothetical protein
MNWYARIFTMIKENIFDITAIGFFLHGLKHQERDTFRKSNFRRELQVGVWGFIYPSGSPSIRGL